MKFITQYINISRWRHVVTYINRGYSIGDTINIAFTKRYVLYIVYFCCNANLFSLKFGWSYIWLFLGMFILTPIPKSLHVFLYTVVLWGEIYLKIVIQCPITLIKGLRGRRRGFCHFYLKCSYWLIGLSTSVT